MTTSFAGAIAARLQGAHERRQRREDEDMTDGAKKTADESVWSPEKREVVDTLAESVYDALLKLAEKKSPQASAVTAERVVELERQLADARSDVERLQKLADKTALAAANRALGPDAGERLVELERQLAAEQEAVAKLERSNDQFAAQLTEVREDYKRAVRLLAQAYVAREVPWSDVAAGMMTIARDGTPWMVGTWDAAYSTVTLLRGNDAFQKTPKPGETVRVLVPYVTPEQAEQLVKSELGGRA